MKNLILLFLALALNQGAKAQIIEEITSEDKTIKWTMTDAELGARFEQGAQTLHHQNVTPRLGSTVDILPDTLFVGEPFEMHHVVLTGHTTTFDLYDCRGEKPHKIATKCASAYIRGSNVVHITLDNPGVYEIVAYDEQRVAEEPQPQNWMARWRVTVHDRKNPQNPAK